MDPPRLHPGAPRRDEPLLRRPPHPLRNWRCTQWDDGRKDAELYDHEKDHSEHTNLASARRQPKVITEMKQLLSAVRKGIQMKTLLTLTLFVAPGVHAAHAAEARTNATLVTVRKIWDAAPHNAFTDLTRFNGQWFCVFREGQKHVSPDGALRVLVSKDGETWSSAARLTSTNSDLRDAKITAVPTGGLMLSGAGALHPPAPARHRSLAWFSKDGRAWSEPAVIGEPNQWLWRTTWHKGAAYSVGYDTGGERFTRLYRSGDGRDFRPLVARLTDEEYPNEASLLFQPDDTALCLLRRDGKPGHGLLGHAPPPYTNWTWKNLGVKIGGPALLRLPDGRLVAVVRLYDGAVRTSLCWLDANAGKLTEALKFPSGGDTSYAGLVWHDELLWVSYYSSHEGKTSIYLAKVRL